jgi:hypothetical protein
MVVSFSEPAIMKECHFEAPSFIVDFLRAFNLLRRSLSYGGGSLIFCDLESWM